MQSFVLRFAFVVVASTALAAPATAMEPIESRIQGFWFGAGVHPLNQRILLIRDHDFVVVTPQGEFTSTFVARENESLNQIDVERYDGGRQLGVFKLDNSKLYLKLAEPNDSRPSIKDVTTASGKPHWHVILDRRPTKQGLQVLQRYLSRRMDVASSQ